MPEYLCKTSYFQVYILVEFTQLWIYAFFKILSTEI